MAFSYEKLSSFLAPINAELLAILESGSWAKWTKEWSLNNSFLSAANILSDKKYKGSNIWITAYWQHRRGYGANLWATAKQLKNAGYYLKPEASRKSIALFAPNLRQVEKEDGTKETKMVGIQAFTVWNFNPHYVGETPNAEMSVAERLTDYQRQGKVEQKHQPIQQAEHLIQQYLTANKIQVNVGEPSYNPQLDRILMPDLQCFSNPASYYSTHLHEIAHSTGHNTRLDRLKNAPFGSPEYAYEELIAELSAVYLSAHLGLEYNLENHASYLGSWLTALTHDVGYFVRAGNAAHKAMEYVLEAVEKQKQPLDNKELIAA